MLSTDVVDALVTRVHEQYAACKFKPSNDYQYTVLAAFVLLSSRSALAPQVTPDATGAFKVVSLATGAKCLPTSRYPPHGDALHDSHAEVLARRALVRWLYEEVQRSTHMSTGSEWIERCVDGKWRLKENVKLHMYISTVPCKIPFSFLSLILLEPSIYSCLSELLNALDGLTNLTFVLSAIRSERRW